MKEVVLWETNWEFNRAILLNELMECVYNNGGKLLGWKNFSLFDKVYELHNRTAIKEAEEIKGIIEARNRYLSKTGKQARTDMDNGYDMAYEEAKRAGDRYIISQFTSYVRYLEDNYTVFFELDDNPFNPFYFSKTTIGEDLKTEYKCYLKELEDKEWWTDRLLSYKITESETKEIAKKIHALLSKKRNSAYVTSRKRVYDISGKYTYTYVKDKRVEDYEIVQYRPMEWKCVSK